MIGIVGPASFRQIERAGVCSESPERSINKCTNYYLHTPYQAAERMIRKQPVFSDLFQNTAF